MNWRVGQMDKISERTESDNMGTYLDLEREETIPEDVELGESKERKDRNVSGTKESRRGRTTQSKRQNVEAKDATYVAIPKLTNTQVTDNSNKFPTRPPITKQTTGKVHRTQSTPNALGSLEKLNINGSGANVADPKDKKQKSGIKSPRQLKNFSTVTKSRSQSLENLSSKPKSVSLEDLRVAAAKDNVKHSSISSGYKNLYAKKKEGTYDVVEKKKAVRQGRSSTTLSSQANTEASDEPEDHINVVVRVRPLNSNEIARKDQFCCTFPGSAKIEVDSNGSVRQFGYNVVFEPDASQADLFDHSGVKKLIDMALNGYACTALAFGQTGSGKTHTMTGPPQQFQEGKQVDPEMYGIIQRSLNYLFKQLNAQQGTKIVRASYLEIYNEQVIDLLNPNMRRYLQVRWSKNKGFYVENLFVVECETEDDLMAVLEEGMRNRQTGSHGLNEFSSRSHSMLMLTIDSEQVDPDDENLYITKRGKLTFVDLAGSEKVKDSNSTADTLVESNSINKSLLVLGNCISSLGDHKRRQGHIPYRDSKLTKLLADSLGGNGVTLMICCITPSSHHSSETMNTLRYASRAKKIRTKPVIKMDPREKLILSLKREIKVLRNENHYLREQLEFPAKPKGQLQKENDKNFAKMIKEANGKPNTINTANGSSTANPPERLKQNGAQADEAGLYEMLQEYMVENEALRSENAEMQVVRDKIRQDQQLLYRDNERLMRRIDELERKVNQAGNSWQSMPRQGAHPQEVVRSRDHSPRGSPQYARGGGPPSQPQRLPPPSDLQLRDNPALRDPIYPGSPPQGYSSPTGSGHKGKQPPRGQPMKPPHRLVEPIGQQRPVNEMNGAYMNGHPPPNLPPQMRQAHISSPNRVNELRMDSRRSSQSSSSDAIRDMNEKLKQELYHLEGEIAHHAAINTRTNNTYGSQGSMR